MYLLDAASDRIEILIVERDAARSRATDLEAVIKGLREDLEVY